MVHTIKQHKRLYLAWILILACVSVSVVTSNVLVVAAGILFFLAAFLLPINELIVLLIATLPYANVFKMEPGSTSLFTIAEILVLALAMWKIKKMDASFFVTLIALAVYMLLLSFDQMDFLIIIKALLGFLLVYYACKLLNKNDLIHVGYTLSIGTGVTMLLAQLPRYFSYLQQYFDDINHYVDAGGHVSDVIRNGGFIGDPNYCVMTVMLALSILCLLYYYKQIGFEFWILSAFLGVLGFFTYSKSYFLCFAVFCIFLLLFVLFPKHKVWAIIAIGGICVLTALALSGQIEVFNMIFDRFSDKGSLTTGRNDLNAQYLQYIFSHPKTLLLGDSIVADRFQGASNNVHNIYIELLYKMGVVGTVLYIVTLISSCGRLIVKRGGKRHFVHYLPLLFFLVMYFFLAGVTRYELPVYIVLVCCALKNRDFISSEKTIDK